MKREPKTLQEAIVYFSDPENCREYLIARRWPDGVTCPRCGSQSVTFQQKYTRWQCASHHDRRQFTLKTGTIFEDSPIGLDKWLAAMWQVVNCKNGVSSYEIHRAIGVTQKTAWFMDHRIRLALGIASPKKLSGQVEIDETAIGGLSRNMHKSVRARRITATGNGSAGKVAVMGLLERRGEVRAHVIPNTKLEILQPRVRHDVEAGSQVFTDAWCSYHGLDADYVHQVINHAETYVRGNIHTNGIENFWSLLKRTIKGTYVSVEPFHLFRYLDEQTFRFNTRKGTDADRFHLAVCRIVGKRLTLAEVTGKVGEKPDN